MPKRLVERIRDYAQGNRPDRPTDSPAEATHKETPPAGKPADQQSAFRRKIDEKLKEAGDY